MSHPALELVSVYSTNRCRFAASGSPATNESWVPSPVENGQNHRFIANPYPYAATTP